MMSGRAVAVGVFLLASAATAQAQFVVLTPTGAVRDGLPVLQPYPDASATAAALTRGYSGRLVRLFALEQEFLRRKTGRAPEPAYLVLTDRQGGFPQFGFYLGDAAKPNAGWVDLPRTSRPTGLFGALDQIFPHELLHVIVRQLAGEPRESGGNQVHAVGVRTDPVNAFDEGFAEHAQILAVDDPEAAPDTSALARDAGVLERDDRALAAYRRDLARAWAPVQPARLRFMFWYPRAERVERYHAVKANAFARAAAVPASLLARDDKYAAYLFQNIVPGPPDGQARPAGVMLSTEGVVSHLFWRLVTDPGLQQRYRDDAFYAAFGTSPGEVGPIENVYLKIFTLLYESRPPTAADTLRAWARLMPEDAADLDRITREALLGQSLPDAPEIWLANGALMTGTSLFDQYRALPRVHTFDANAATTLDWLSVPGVTPELAARLLAGVPYADLEALQGGLADAPAASARISDMAAAMVRLRERGASEEQTLSLWAIARSYLWRLGAIMLGATIIGAWLARRAGVRRRWTAALVALTATFLVIALAWIVTSPFWYPFAAPIVIGGVPWAAWRLGRGRGVRTAAHALAAWAMAAVPAMVLILPW